LDVTKPLKLSFLKEKSLTLFEGEPLSH